MYRIVRKEALRPIVTLYEIEAPLVAKKAQPGQFIILRVDENGERIPITINDYNPEKGTVTPVFRDASCWHTDKGVELHREMIVGGRRFLIRSIFSNTEKAKTPTEQMLHVIDSDLKKDTN